MKKGFTLIELLVVISIIALLIGILLPALGAARRTARQMQSNTQVRGIHQANVMFAQSNGGNFAGMESDGDIEPTGPNDQGTERNGGAVGERWAILMEGNYFTGEYCVSPVESGLIEWTSAELTDATEDQFYSFAAIRIGDNNTNTAGEQAPWNASGTNADSSDVVNEWSETLNTEAPIITDRNTGNNADTEVSSIHTEVDSGDWRGSVAYNDNHVVFETTEVLDTRYGGGPFNDANNATVAERDSLFIIDDGEQQPDAGANAFIVYNPDDSAGDNHNP
ncbi:MAG: prepilin-type N-terminal cleavage/methylation domain-containing protein [Planctomycetota bacterium]